MLYQQSAIHVLKTLGFSPDNGTEFLKKLRETLQMPLPQAYVDFMAYAANAPLFGTSDLWVGQMVPSLMEPYTLYSLLQEEIEDWQETWEEEEEERKGVLYELSQRSEADWPELMENFLLIGSDYGAGIALIGIRIQDLSQPDPAVYWCNQDVDISKWHIVEEHLSDFLFSVLTNVLGCIDYDTAERALEKCGWEYEEYFDPEEDDWVSNDAVLERYGIQKSQLKRLRGWNDRPTFLCYDEEKSVFFVGSDDEEEPFLYAIRRHDAPSVFPGM